MRDERKIIRKIEALKKYPLATTKDINLLNKQLMEARMQRIKKMINSLNN